MARSHSWDIFCRVVDNYGDIGVGWRLARQLASEQHAVVRLWVNDLGRLHALCPQIDAFGARQEAEGVEVYRWDENVPAVTPAQVVIDAFGCGLPEPYIAAMVERTPRPLWITLEYLSAEPWVREHHGLPSPHPRWPLKRYFYFPGFTPGTGGILREADLLVRRDAYGDSERHRFWASAGFDPPPAGADVVSLFAYRDAPIARLLAGWERGDRVTIVAIPEGEVVDAVISYLGAGAAVGRAYRRGGLEVRIVPFAAQSCYDELLWTCDCNFVRGEDSFVRAQWAARPLVWQIYPQQERAHVRKLEAFLDLYCNGLPAAAALAQRGMWRAWNLVDDPARLSVAWRAFREQRTVLEAHAGAWGARLATSGDLVGKLVQFCVNKVKC